MRVLAIYLTAALVVWPPAAILLHRDTGPTDRFGYIVGGLMVAVAWPLSILALYVTLVSKERAVDTRD